MANLKQHKLGWIGIGRMGYAMAERLAKAGCDITVWNRTQSKAEPLARSGAKIAGSLTELAACDIVFTMVSTGKDVKEVLFGANGVLSAKGAKPKIVVDSTSISIEESGDLRQKLEGQGVKLLAAPVSGNDKVVQAGKLMFVISGARAAYDTARPYLDLSVVIQSLCELTVLAQKAGMPRHAFLAFLNESIFGCMFSRYKTPALVNLDFHVTFTPELLRKDIDLGLSAGRELGVPMPLASVTRDLVQTLIGHGYTDKDFSALLLLQAEASGIELTSENVQVSDGLSS
jgi:3-hydroxyisobutyrate dehydrogenase